MWGRTSRVFVVLALGASAASATVPALADDAPGGDQPSTAPERGIAIDPRLLDVTFELSRTSRRLEAAERDATLAEQRLSGAQATIGVTEGFIRTNRPSVEYARALVRENALLAYQHHAAAVDASLATSSPDELGRADEYLHATHGVDRKRFAILQASQEALERAQAQRVEARDQLASLTSELDREVETLRTLRAQQEELLVEFGAVPVMGDSWLTAEQLAAWYRSTGHEPKLAPGTTIDDLARFYVEEGNAEHVRGDLAFAQGVIESVYFSVAAGNNYSGIGACDSCSGGFGFASPREGVRRADPAPSQLRRPRQPGGQPGLPAGEGPVPRRSRGRRPGLRHLLPQGHGAAVEPDGQRQLGDRPDVRGQGHRAVRPHRCVHGRSLTVASLHREVAKLHALFKRRPPGSRRVRAA